MALFTFTRARFAHAVTLSLALLMSLVASSAMAQAHFNRVDYTAPGTIRAAVGDFNEDGIVDIVAATTSGIIEPHFVSILLGAGGGVFGAPTDFAAGYSPYDLVVLDFDQDSHLDVAVVNLTLGGSQVTLLRGDGLGNLAAQPALVTVTDDYHRLTVGDFNGDNFPDLAVDNYNQNRVEVLLNDQSLGVSLPVITSAPFPDTQNTPVLGPAVDFDGDLRLDLVVLEGYNVQRAHILKGGGDGTFTEFPGSPIGVGNKPFDSVVGDFNLDGRFDIAVISEFSTTILLGNGGGGFTTSSFAAGGYYIRTGDFDGDTYPDLALVTTGGSIDIWRGDGAGVFTYESTRSAAGEKPVVANLDGDTKLDIAQASGQVSVYLNSTQNTTTTLASSPNPSTLGLTATFTATVSGPAPSGFMTFKADTVNIPDCGASGVVTFSGSTAVCSTTSLSLGSHAITAEFVGDAPYNNSNATLSGGHLVVAPVAPPLVNFVAAPGPTAVGAAPVAVAVGDFNNDGRQDWVVANSGGNSVSLAAGNGDGTFALSGGPIPVGNNPRSIAAADFDGDLIPDLAVANADSNDVSILLNNGAGVFTPTLTLTAGTTPNAVVAGEFDGDGRKDLAVTNFSDDTVSIWLGDGFGGFAGPTTVLVGDGPIALAVGDFNGDGDQDLAVANTTGNNVSLLTGNGNGTFTGGGTFPAGTGPISVAVGDLNNDGRSDLAVANNGSDNVSVLINDGLGGFLAAANFAAGDSPRALVVGDFNGDRRPDVAVANQNDDNVSILIGNGLGALGAPVNFPAGDGPFGLAAGDFNQDSKPDLAVANITSGNVSILLGQGFSKTTLAGTGTGPVSISVGDFDLDGRRDLAVVNATSGNASILKNNGAGAFSPAGLIALGARPSSIAVGHFDTDGGLDLAVANRDSQNLSIRLDDGTGTFVFGSSNPATAGPSPVAIASGDFNGDGSMDLVTANKLTDSLSIWMGDVFGAFALLSPDLTAGDVTSVAVGDMDGDSDLDLVTADFSLGTVSVYLGNGDGTFAPPTPFTAPSLPISVGLGDFNKDGRLDVVTANAGGNNVSILLGAGAPGSLGAAAPFPVGSQPSSIAVTDFNADQKPDLVVANAGSDDISILLGTGSGSFNGPINFGVGDQPAFVTTGDFNNDGKPDVAVANYGGGTGNTVSILMNTFSTPPAQPTNPVATAAPGQITITFTPPVADGGSPIIGYTVKCNPDDVLAFAPPSATSVTLTGLNNGTLYTCAVSAESIVGSGPASAPVTATPNLATASISVVSSSNPVLLGSFVTFTATVIGFNPTGTVDFTDDIDGPLCTGVTLSAGVAQCSINTLTAGSPHTITVSYSGDVNNTPITGPPLVGQTVVPGVNFSGPPLAYAVTGPHSLTLADTNFDSTNDLVVTASPSSIQTLLGQPDGSFSFPPIPTPVGANPVAAVAGTFDADLIQDIVVINRDDGTISVLLGSGLPAPVPTIFVGAQPSAGATGYFDNDAFADLAITNFADNTVTILLGDGTGGFAEPLGGPFPAGDGGPSAVVVGDFDNNGYNDLAVTNQTANEVSILFGNNDGTFGTPVDFAVGTGPSAVIATYLDSDSILDLAVTNSVSNDVTILIGDGGGGFTPFGPFPVNSLGPVSVTRADLNLDGWADLAVANGGCEDVSLLFGDGTGKFSAPFFIDTGLDSHPTSVVTADFNGDGRFDLAVANSGTDEVLVFLNSGLPAVTNLGVTNITITSADVSAYVTGVGGSLLTDTGFVYSVTTTEPTPEIGAFGVTQESLGAGGVGSMSTTLSGLASLTGYSFRAYATNAMGTTYTPVGTFATLSSCPAITLGSLPNGLVNDWYYGSFAASGGADPYTYGVTGSLPPGLVFDADFADLLGAPTSTGTYTFDITATDANSCTGVQSYTVHIGTAVASGDLVIREFRLRGPAGAEDEYIEIFNRTPSTLTLVAVDGSAGFGVAKETAAGTLVFTIPNGTRLQPRGYYLGANTTGGTGYSLTNSGGANASAPDRTWTDDIADDTGIALFRSSSTFTDPVDAVGFTSSESPFKEGPLGTGLPLVGDLGPSGTKETAFMRAVVNFVVKDTGNNAGDFRFASTDAEPYNGVSSALGAPGPQNQDAQWDRLSGIVVELADPTKSTTAVPNRKATVGSPSTYEFRRKLTNNTGQRLARVRVRIVDITTFRGTGYATPSQADVREVSSIDGPINVFGQGTPTAYGMDIEDPPVQTIGGGYNGSLLVHLPGGGLNDGASMYLNLKFRIHRSGNYLISFIIEAVDDQVS